MEDCEGLALADSLGVRDWLGEGVAVIVCETDPLGVAAELGVAVGLKEPERELLGVPERDCVALVLCDGLCVTLRLCDALCVTLGVPDTLPELDCDALNDTVML